MRNCIPGISTECYHHSVQVQSTGSQTATRTSYDTNFCIHGTQWFSSQWTHFSNRLSTFNKDKTEPNKKKMKVETRLMMLCYVVILVASVSAREKKPKGAQLYTNCIKQLIRVNVKLVTCGGWPSQQIQTRNRNGCAALVSNRCHFHSERFASVGSLSKSLLPWSLRTNSSHWNGNSSAFLAKTALHNNFCLWRLIV